MSTRAVYRFIDAGVPPKSSEHIQVYIHSDGYPTWAWNYFDAVFQAKNAWELPRFEADEFAAAFIAANKDRPGGVRCMNAGDKNLPSDIAYLYELQPASAGSADLRLTIWTSGARRKKLWSGSVQQFITEHGAQCEENENA